MNPTPGILYQIDGKIVCAEREMPDIVKFSNDAVTISLYGIWLSECKGVVNAECMDEEDPNPIIAVLDIDPGNVLLCRQGQKVLKVPKRDKVKIVKLI